MRVFKGDLSGHLMDFEEFVWMLSILHKNAERQSKYQFLFKVFDIDQDRYVSNQDLQQIIYKLYGYKADGLGLNISEAKVGVDKELLNEKMKIYITHIFNTYDGNQDNKLTESEFYEIFSEENSQKILKLTSIEFLS